jgi:hypothetical protein
VKACFEKHLSPISYNDTLNSTSISQATGPTSTNVIRSDAIYRFNGKLKIISHGELLSSKNGSNNLCHLG